MAVLAGAGRPARRQRRPVEFDDERLQLPCGQAPVLSASGRDLAFSSPSGRLDPRFPGGGTFFRDLRHSRPRPVSAGDAREPIAISGDGRFVSYDGDVLHLRGPMH